MKVSKITKEQAKDILIRTVKTFVAAGAMAIGTLGLPTKDNWQSIIITFGSAGLTAVWNMVIKAFQESEA